MKNLRISIFACFIFLCCSRISLSQAIYGSTELDIDPDTGTVTATCYTETDNYAAVYYQARVNCFVTDSNNNVVASGGASDDSGQGYAQFVVSFDGVPGETYTASSGHEVLVVDTVVVEDPSQPIALHYYDDYYDFGFFNADPQTYDGYFALGSPGPETLTQTKIDHAANTVVKLVFPNVPDHLSVVTDTAVTINCTNGTTLQRQVNYNVLDINQAIISRTISVMETAYPPLISSCTGAPAYTSFACQPISSGNFTDAFSAGCPGTPQLATGCGFTVPDQTWNWCSTIAPGSIGHIGQDLVYNNIISIGGNSSPMTPGTTFPK